MDGFVKPNLTGIVLYTGDGPGGDGIVSIRVLGFRRNAVYSFWRSRVIGRLQRRARVEILGTNGSRPRRAIDDIENRRAIVLKAPVRPINAKK